MIELQNSKAVIFGLEGLALNENEKTFFLKNNPLGFIVFKRNIDNPLQLQTLTRDLKNLFPNRFVPILIDQENGRVQRLCPPHWPQYKAARQFGLMYENENPSKAINDLVNETLATANSLNDTGINVNCAPILDILHPKTHAIIGDRSFSNEIETIVTLSCEVIKTYQDNNIIPIIKHIPGHGRATQDSHTQLPKVHDTLDVLKKSDFYVFKKVNSIIKGAWAMTAHILYDSIDSQFCATESTIIVNDIIRNYMEYDGFLITDAIEMKALKGTWKQRVLNSMNAGVDCILHCTGNMKEMMDIVEHVPLISTESNRRLLNSLKSLKNFKNFKNSA
jgi:beta-N-acetylhexosaminidase